MERETDPGRLRIDGARLLVRAGADVRVKDKSGADVETLLEENGLTMRDVTEDAVPGGATNGADER